MNGYFKRWAWKLVVEFQGMCGLLSLAVSDWSVPFTSLAALIAKACEPVAHRFLNLLAQSHKI